MATNFLSDLLGYGSAADAATSGYNAAYTTAVPSLTQATSDITNYGTAALSPYTKLLKSSTAGAKDYAAALGIGPNVDPNVIGAKIATTPGYQFQLGQGLQAIDRNQAAKGLFTSPGTGAAEDTFAQGLASQYYNNYIQSLLPFLNQQTTAAGGVSGVNTGLGTSLSANDQALANLGYNTQSSIGNVQSAADIAGANALTSLLGGVISGGAKIAGAGGFGNPFGIPGASPATNPLATPRTS